jgi:hypothetical protein
MNGWIKTIGPIQDENCGGRLVVEWPEWIVGRHNWEVMEILWEQRGYCPKCQ